MSATFNAMDLNNDGVISKAERNAACGAPVSRTPSVRNVAAPVASYAAPASTNSVVPEVATHSCRPTGPVVAPMPVVGSALNYNMPQATLSQDAQRTVLHAAFNVMDINHDGKINCQEFAAVVNKPGGVSNQPQNASLMAPSLKTSSGTPTLSYSIPAGATSWASPAPAVPCGTSESDEKGLELNYNFTHPFFQNSNDSERFTNAPSTTCTTPSTIGVGMPTIGTYVAPSAELTALTYTAPPQALTITQPASFVPQTTYAMPGAQMVLAQPSAPTVLAQPSVPTVLSSSIASSAADAASVTFRAAPPTTTAPAFATSAPVPSQYVAPTTYSPPAVSYGMPVVTSTLSAPIVSTFCAAPMSATMSGPSVSVPGASGEVKQEVMEPAITYTASAATVASVAPTVTYTAPPATMTAVPVTAAPILASSVEANAATSFVADQPLNNSTPASSQVMSNAVKQPVTNIAPTLASNSIERTVKQVPPPMSRVTPVTSTVIEQSVTSTVVEQTAPFITYTSPGTAAHVAEYSAPASMVAMDACGSALSCTTMSMNMAVPSMTYSAPLGSYSTPVTMAPVTYAVAARSTPVASYSVATTSSSSMGMPLGPLNATQAAVVNSAFNALDRNHDGMITRSEFNAALSQR